jgi:hypothetical protein
MEIQSIKGCAYCGKYGMALVQLDASESKLHHGTICHPWCFCDSEDTPEKQAVIGSSFWGLAPLLFLLQLMNVRMGIVMKMNVAIGALALYEIRSSLLNNVGVGLGIAMFLYFYFYVEKSRKLRALRFVGEVAVYTLYITYRTSWSFASASVQQIWQLREVANGNQFFPNASSEKELEMFRNALKSPYPDPLTVVSQYVSIYFAILCMYRGCVMLRMMTLRDDASCKRLAASLCLNFTEYGLDIHMFFCLIVGIVGYALYGNMLQLENVVMMIGAASIALTLLPTAWFIRCHSVYL